MFVSFESYDIQLFVSLSTCVTATKGEKGETEMRGEGIEKKKAESHLPFSFLTLTSPLSPFLLHPFLPPSLPLPVVCVLCSPSR